MRTILGVEDTITGIILTEVKGSEHSLARVSAKRIIEFLSDENNLNVPPIEKNITESKPLTFGELKVGEHFMDFPTDGDDDGHGGFRGGFYVFQKTESTLTKFEDVFENAVRKTDGAKSTFPDMMLVYKVIL